VSNWNEPELVVFRAYLSLQARGLTCGFFQRLTQRNRRAEVSCPIGVPGEALDAGRIDGPRITHMSNEQVLLTVLIACPARPHEIVFTVEFERGRVDTPFIAGIADLGLESPRALDRVVIVVLDDIDTMGSIVAGIGGEVDILLVAPAMELGRPQLVRPLVSRLRCPNRLLVCMS
jgi:hypothetical protein